MSDFSGTLTVDMEGELLAQVVVDHWHAGAGSTLFLEEVVHAHEVTGLSLDTIKAITDAVNDYRGHDFDVDVLNHAFVPQENMKAVCDLLDEIVGLCVRM